MIKNTRFALTGTRLAKLCGVSQGTVDRALHGRKEISEETRRHILHVAKQYGFIPSDGMPGERDKRGIVGIVVLDVANEYFSNLIMDIEGQCREMGYAVVVMFSHKDPQSERRCVESLYQMGADGIILCPVCGKAGSEDAEIYSRYLHSLEIPVVTVGNRIAGISYVGIDDYAAMKEATERVISRGYDRLIYPSPVVADCDINAYAQMMRMRAFCETAEKCGIPEGRRIVCSMGEAREQIAAQTGKTALICPSDILALSLFEDAKKAGAGMIGFDNISTIDTVGLRLDSVSYDIKQTAKKTMALIAKGYDPTPTEYIVGHSIISRGSI